jgi:formate C-acetyltransferase
MSWQGQYLTLKDIRTTDRIRKLRRELVQAEPSVCSERARIVTQSYTSTEGQPMVIRRAKAIRDILAEMTIRVWEDELIVGNQASNRRAAPVFPEWGIYWLERQLDEIETRPQDRMAVPAQVKEESRSIFPYWKGKNVYDHVWGTLPGEVKKARTAYVFTVDLYERGSFGHMIYDSPRILREGLQGIKAEVAEYLDGADLAEPAQIPKVHFWQAVNIVCDAIIHFAQRYAALARRTAGDGNLASQRQAELLKIAEVCDQVPEKGARNFWEAVQTIWFLQLAIQLEGNGNSVSLGRLDRHLYPYFRQDMERGQIDLEKGQELLDSLWLKLNEIIKVWDTEATRVHAGWPMTQNVIIGGQDGNGQDSTNELTFMFLNAQEHIRLSAPQFTMRVQAGTPDELLLRACEVIRGGGGMPALFGDEAIIPGLQKLGIPLAEARNYGMVGCVEPSVIGAFGRNNGGYFNLARIVDLAINNGIDRLTGEPLGPRTGSASDMRSFDELLTAVRKQMAHFVRLLAIEDNIIEMVQAELTPHVLASTLIPGCLEKGKDITSGGALYNWTPPFGVGLATAADSLCAVKKLVFDERVLSLKDLNQTLDNPEGEAAKAIRPALLKCPKYGNDNGEVDGFARFVADTFFTEVEKYKTWRGGGFVGGLFSLSSTVPHGWKTGATADGRLATTPVSDSISPTNGMDRHGPTAVLLSASVLDHSRCPGGNVLNLKFTPGAVESGSSLAKFAQLIKTYLVDLRGLEVQINVVSAATLKDAQLHPESYRDLVIRVAGYSARFVELAREIQDDIIARTEHVGL